MKSANEKSLGYFYWIITATALMWTLAFISSAAWNVHRERQQTRELVEKEASANFNKDQAFRLWGTKHGGVYVPPTEKTPPNPYLSHIPDRDLVLPSGKRLTLMNPAYMVRQMMADFAELYGVRGRITSLKPLNPANAPDVWEKEALAAFEKGAREFSAITEREGQSSFRLMRPMVAQTGCLKCHGHQGYRAGDIRGGVGVVVPMAPFLTLERRTINAMLLSHLLLWLFGSAALGMFFLQGKRSILEQMRADEAQRLSEARFRNVVENTSDWVWEVDGNGVYTFASQSIQDLLGYEPEEMLGRTAFDFMPPAEAKRVAGIFARVAADRKPLRYLEKINLRKDGRQVTVETCGVPFFGPEGELQGYRGVDRDITERKKREALERARSHLVQFSLAHTTDEVLEETLNELEKLTGSLIAFYHFVAEDQTALTLQNWSTRTKAEFCKAEGQGSHYPVSQAGVWVDCVHQRKAVIHNDYASLPHRKGMPPGHAEVVRELVVPVFRGEKIQAIIGIGNKPAAYTEQDIEAVSLLADLSWEIAERKRTEDAVRASEARYRSHLEVTRQIAWVTDRNGQVVEDIPLFRNFSGQSFEEVKGAGWTKVIHPDDLEHTLAAWDKAVTTKSGFEVECRMRRHDGAYRQLLARAFPVFKADGTLLEWVGVCIDISDLKQLEQETKKTAAEWSAAMDASEDVIYLLDLNRCLTRANKAFYQMVRATPEYALGRQIVELVHPEGEPTPCQVCQAQEELRDLVLIMETDHPDNPAGRPLEITLKVVRDLGGAPVSMLMTLHDLSHDRKIQEELTKYREHLEELVKARTEELARKNAELAELNRHFVGRELRMAELKERIAELEQAQAKILQDTEAGKNV